MQEDRNAESPEIISVATVSDVSSEGADWTAWVWSEEAFHGTIVVVAVDEVAGVRGGKGDVVKEGAKLGT